MQAIITVVGKDRVGIIAEVSKLLAENKINIIDISQNIVKDYFNMFMIVDLSEAEASFKTIKEQLLQCAKDLGVELNFQRSEIFETMYRVASAGDHSD